MPMHDWSGKASFFRAMHGRWMSQLCNALNAGILPDELFALEFNVAGRFGRDILSLEEHPDDEANFRRPRQWAAVIRRVTTAGPSPSSRWHRR